MSHPRDGAAAPQRPTEPPPAGQLAALKELNVSYNRLSSVPEQLGACGGLRRLELSGNHLWELPFQVGHRCSRPAPMMSPP